MIDGLILADKKSIYDSRGKSCKLHSKDESNIDELFLSYSRKNVIRGIHFQEEPYSQRKKVTVLKGKIIDVVVDLRPVSKTFLEVDEFDIEEDSNFSVLIPKGCGHGFLALEDENIVLYEIEGCYNKEYDKGILWNSIGYEWNIEYPVLSERDQQFITLEEYLKGAQKDGCRL